MKFIKAIVDELPETCNDCEKSCFESGCHYDRFYCEILDETIKASRELLSCKDIEGFKPDWCPLVSASDVESFVTQIDGEIFGTEENLKYSLVESKDT